MNWIWTIGAPLVRALMSIVFRIRIEGIEHVPKSGAVILAPNHLSVLDGPAVSAVTGTHRWRATRNLIAAEVFRGDRLDPRAGATGSDPPRHRRHRRLAEAVAAAESGSCVGIFPEGRVGDDPEDGLQRIRSGLTRIAIPSGAPVVPVGIWGTHDVWPRSGLDRMSLLRRHTLGVVYGDALVPHPGESPTTFRERFRVALEVAVARARTIAGGPS